MYKKDRSLGIFDLTSGRQGGSAFIELSGELDYARVPEVDHEIRAAEKSGASSIVISLQYLTYIDSSGLRLLLEAHSRLGEDPERLRFRRSEHPAVVEILEATRTADILY